MRPRYLAFALALTLASGVAAAPLTQARAAIDVTIDVAPPPLPVYDQPPLPGPGYVWVPGYWSYDGDFGYYWVPGTWIEPPQVGLLWTPGYWAWRNGDYAWSDGYWGPTVGFYGGVDYGFGYPGDGFYGGRWEHGHFAYNTAAWHVGGVHVEHSYRQTYSRPEHASHVSFNGGNGGITARPTAEQERAAHEHHVAATAIQTRQASEARSDPRLRAATNHGAPPVAATARAGDFKAHPVAATNRPNPRIGTEHNAARPGATPAERNAAHPGATPAERNAAHPGEHNAARPGEHNAARPGEAPAERNAARPGLTRPERNAARPEANPSERNAPAHLGMTPTQHEARPGATPAERNAARPTPERNAAHPASPNAEMHRAGPPRAERPAVAHPERPAVHPAPAARPAMAPHPAARPMPAPHPAAHPAAPDRREEKKP